MNIAFIPVRGGSKSIPLKNIKPIFGKPLVLWTAAAAVGASCIDRVVIATDSDAIRMCLSESGLPKIEIYDRLPENAADTSSTEDVMLEFIERSSLRANDRFFLIQATSPLLQSVHIEEACKTLRETGGDSLLTAVRDKRFYWNENGKPLNYDVQQRPRRQDFAGALMENGALYINSVENILRDRNRLSGNIVVYEMPEYTGVEIDEPDDWVIVEQLMKRHLADPRSPSADIRLFVTDVDGVMTDAGMYYGSDGVELKKFNTRDAVGLRLLRERGIKTAIITGENSRCVQDRADKIKIDYVFQGIEDKAAVLRQIWRETGITPGETAYIGDDVNDLSAIRIVGRSACPADAAEAVKAEVDVVLTRNGGHGAVREWCECVLKAGAEVPSRKDAYEKWE
ncbi:MAG TPA: acylneuraminate cytidylyltransferase [Planctomycetaceae bacterium]|nr:acylneuraminate cytidylyltransferase [Planctomycetaceae bacterium]